MTSERAWHKKPWFVIPMILVVGVGLGVIITNLLRGDGGEPESQTSTPSTAPLSESKGDDETSGSPAVDGCLGGEATDEAVIAALQEAPLTSEGLAAAARTVARWLLQYPMAENAKQIAGEISKSELTATALVDSMTAAAQSLSLDGYTAAKVSANDSGYQLGSAEVLGYEGEISTVDVLVYRDLVGNGAPDERQKIVININLMNVGGEWKLFAGAPPGADEPADEGNFIEYTGGC